MVHKHINMLDSNDYNKTCTDLFDHHGVVGEKMVTRLNDAFQAVTGGKHPVFVDWR